MVLDWQSNWPELSNHFGNMPSCWVEKGGWGPREIQIQDHRDVQNCCRPRRTGLAGQVRLRG